eukprot:TRINITY_DN29691_c0_g1_i1.p2 TRINITY_DN29691_c0_g1~~TRINITY_DN29691_c0_g1_i1.p2  ORF type:complete len:194 (-),score=33.97 TRINITY_DN29691_c0_g1_i1:1251-1832(-)
MIKIVNGKIVREGMVSSASGSPVPQRRRCSIQDLQIQEFQQEQLQKLSAVSEEEPAQPLSWTEILSLKINVFGLQLSAKNLMILSLVAFMWTGLTGLLVSLLALYIGTLFSNGINPTQVSQVSEESLSEKNSPSLRTSGNLPASPSLRTSGGSNSSPIIRPIGSPSLRPLTHPRLVTLKSLELDAAIPAGTSA